MLILWEMYKNKVYSKGRSEERKEWEAWNSRRCAAEAEGIKFDDLPPNAEDRSAHTHQAS